MKKFRAIILLVLMSLLSMTSCNTKAEQKEIIATVDSFEKSQEIILLTNDYLVIRDKRYALSEMKYNGKQCNALFLEEDGFYSYTYDEGNLAVEFLFTPYDGFESELLGEAVLPSNEINAFFGDRCFWFRTDDPTVSKFKQIYYCWSIDTKQGQIFNTDVIPSNYEYATDNNRSQDYSFVYTSEFYADYLDVTHNETGVTKRISNAILDTFEEGKKINAIDEATVFNISKVFERDGDIYFTTYLSVGTVGTPCYYYVVKWNFESEECDFYTAIYYEEYQASALDMYIL